MRSSPHRSATDNASPQPPPGALDLMRGAQAAISAAHTRFAMEGANLLSTTLLANVIETMIAELSDRWRVEYDRPSVLKLFGFKYIILRNRMK